MNKHSEKSSLPKDFFLLNEPEFSNPDDPNRPNRLCICFSDVHFTDGTVGNQSAEAVVWENVFNRIQDLCVLHDIDELTLLLVGDVADMIRTAEWSENGVYPWDRDNAQFNGILQKIMRGIINKHSVPPKPCENPGFFYWLQHLPQALEGHEYKSRKSRIAKIQTLVLLGNHDKEMFADDETLKMFYKACLGRSVDNHSENRLTDDYRRWLGKMYFGDENHYLDPERQSVPWLPFYWGDRGFRLFVTHGQWRDEDNSRRIAPQGGRPGWKAGDGWNLDIWRQLKYAPFTESCFGDTVAAGVLSGFIFRSKRRLQELPATAPEEKEEIARLMKILDELDLYRPTYAAVGRIIKETWRLRTLGAGLVAARDIIENELLDSVHNWLGWDFTLESAGSVLKVGLRIARVLVSVIKLLGARIELGFLYLMMWGMTQLKQGLFHISDAPSYKEMKAFPTFLQAYRDYGFRIHGEGHTHIPLEEELYFKQPDTPKDRKSYTYINFGTWRDQIVIARKRKYRRRGVGRALCVLDLLPDIECGDEERRFAYWVEDILTWGDHLDRF